MKRGDHLVSPRNGYFHHGLYIGNGEVIHYPGFSEAFDKGAIEITAIDEFTQGYGYGNDCIDESQYGRMSIDETNGLLYICTKTGWLAK